jgi:hypothetical protein
MFLTSRRTQFPPWPRGAIAAALIAITVSAPRAQPAAEPAPLKKFLQEHLGRGGRPADLTTRYQFAVVDLDGSGRKDVIAYITGRTWCGSGGCTTLVLAPQGGSYRVVSSISISRTPIRVMAATTNGWHDLGVWVGGGGIVPGYEADLPFDGKSYPTNPSVPPARPTKGGLDGDTALPANNAGLSLYP